jgi:uncharacterized protein YneF (UPF0154 family)
MSIIVSLIIWTIVAIPLAIALGMYLQRTYSKRGIGPVLTDEGIPIIREDQGGITPLTSTKARHPSHPPRE